MLPVPAGTLKLIGSPTVCVPKGNTCVLGNELETTGRRQAGVVVLHIAGGRQTLPKAAQQL